MPDSPDWVLVLEYSWPFPLESPFMSFALKNLICPSRPEPPMGLFWFKSSVVSVVLDDSVWSVAIRLPSSLFDGTRLLISFCGNDV